MKCDSSAINAVLQDRKLQDDIRRILEELPIAEGPIDSIDRRIARHAVAVGEGRIVVRTDNGNAYDAQGCVTGSEGERRRVVEGLPSLTMDDSVLVCRADQSSAKLWLHVDPIAPIGGKPDVGTVLPPPPPPPPPPGPEKDRARIIARAEKEPLVSLRLAARTPADAATLAGLAQPLGANSLTQSVRLSGELRGGGTVGFRAEGLPLGHAANPLEIARTLHRGLTDEADFEAELALHFGDAGRTGLAGPLSCLCDQAPDGIELEAKFGRPEEVEQ